MNKRVLLVVFMIVALFLRPAYATSNIGSLPVAKLEFKDVLIAKVISPANAASSCGGLWKKEGQACDLTKLTAYSKSEDDMIVAMLADLTKRVNEFHSWIKQVNYKSVPGLTENQILYFKIWSNPVMVSEYHKDAAKCWSQMKSKRSSSLCSACSGQNSKYFIGTKAVIDQNVCDVMLDSCLSFFSDSLDIPIGVQAIKKVFLSYTFPPSFTSSTKESSKESIATRFVGLTDKFMLDIQTLNIRDLIHDRQKSSKTSNEFKQASINLCDYFIRIRKEPLLVPIIRILKFMVPGAKLAVYRPILGADQTTLHKLAHTYWAVLEEIEKEVTIVEREESSAEASNKIDQERSKLALSIMSRSNVPFGQALSTSRSLNSGDNTATSLFNFVPSTDLLNGDVVILSSPGSFATIDSASGSISKNMLGNTLPMNLATDFP